MMTEAEAWVRSIESEMDRDVFTPGIAAKNAGVGELVDRYAQKVAVSQSLSSSSRHLPPIRLDTI